MLIFWYMISWCWKTGYPCGIQENKVRSTIIKTLRRLVTVVHAAWIMPDFSKHEIGVAFQSWIRMVLISSELTQSLNRNFDKLQIHYNIHETFTQYIVRAYVEIIIFDYIYCGRFTYLFFTVTGVVTWYKTT